MQLRSVLVVLVATCATPPTLYGCEPASRDFRSGAESGLAGSGGRGGEKGNDGGAGGDLATGGTAGAAGGSDSNGGEGNVAGADNQAGAGNEAGTGNTGGTAGNGGAGGTAGAGPGVIDIEAGEHHTCALLSSGALRCWGRNTYGQLGYGHDEDIGDDESPASAGDVPVGGAVRQIALGRSHTCGLLTSGAVRCWGLNGSGQLGYGNTDGIGVNDTPASAGDVPVGGTVEQIAAGADHTCALLTTGAVRCWGAGDYGALGYGNSADIGDNEIPSSLATVSIGAGVQQITAGDQHSCALLTSSAVRCWGRGLYGRLGYGDTDDVGDNETPASKGNVPLGATAQQVSGGLAYTCALLTTGAVRCWGIAQYGRLGYGSGAASDNIGDDETPADAGDLSLAGEIRTVATGSTGSHTCVLHTTGAVRCWGLGLNGQLGYGNTSSNDDASIAGEIDVGIAVQALAVGGSHSCALLVGGAVRCWGNGSYGRLGYGNVSNVGDNETPASAGDVEVL